MSRGRLPGSGPGKLLITIHFGRPTGADRQQYASRGTVTIMGQTQPASREGAPGLRRASESTSHFAARLPDLDPARRTAGPRLNFPELGDSLLQVEAVGPEVVQLGLLLIGYGRGVYCCGVVPEFIQVGKVGQHRHYGRLVQAELDGRLT